MYHFLSEIKLNNFLLIARKMIFSFFKFSPSQSLGCTDFNIISLKQRDNFIYPRKKVCAHFNLRSAQSSAIASPPTRIHSIIKVNQISNVIKFSITKWTHRRSSENSHTKQLSLYDLIYIFDTKRALHCLLLRAAEQSFLRQPLWCAHSGNTQPVIKRPVADLL